MNVESKAMDTPSLESSPGGIQNDLSIPCIEQSDADWLCKHPMVSVLMTTYNHERFIRGCRGGVDAGNGFWALKGQIPYFPSAYVFPLRKYHFADTEFLGPRDANAILQHFFGNFMILPPEDEQVPKHDWVEFRDC